MNGSQTILKECQLKLLPELFIIESLDIEDEYNDCLEGQRLRTMLAMSGKECKYFYIRTKKEFCEILGEFAESRYRYLHLSCHGGRSGKTMGLWTTYDHLAFPTLGKILTPYIKKRRVFVSACNAAKPALAENLLAKTGCYSVMGPSESIDFDDAALFWATFYHLMFRKDTERMKRKDIEKIGRKVADLFDVRMRLWLRDGDSTATMVQL